MATATRALMEKVTADPELFYDKLKDRAYAYEDSPIRIYGRYLRWKAKSPGTAIKLRGFLQGTGRCRSANG
ncbi:MAG: hypothetical protein ACLR8Y_17815 [Alistipes indistinctus]